MMKLISWYGMVTLVLELPRMVPHVDGFSQVASIAHTTRSMSNRLVDYVPKATKSFSKKKNIEYEEKKDSKPLIAEYNDDAFGLVFLSGCFVARDVIFAAIFLGCSAVTTIAVRQRVISFSNQVPAIVAGISLGLATSVSMILFGSSDPNLLVSNGGIVWEWVTAKSDHAIQVELAVCSISVVYGFVVSPWLTKEDSS